MSNQNAFFQPIWAANWVKSKIYNEKWPSERVRDNEDFNPRFNLLLTSTNKQQLMRIVTVFLLHLQSHKSPGPLSKLPSLKALKRGNFNLKKHLSHESWADWMRCTFIGRGNTLKNSIGKCTFENWLDQITYRNLSRCIYQKTFTCVKNHLVK